MVSGDCSTAGTRSFPGTRTRRIRCTGPFRRVPTRRRAISCRQTIMQVPNQYHVSRTLRGEVRGTTAGRIDNEYCNYYYAAAGRRAGVECVFSTITYYNIVRTLLSHRYVSRVIQYIIILIVMGIIIYIILPTAPRPNAERFIGTLKTRFDSSVQCSRITID